MKYFIIILGLSILINLSSCAQTTSEDCLQKGDTFYKQKEYLQAIEQYDKAIEKDSKFIAAYINKGKALEYVRKFQEAIDNYDALMKTFPNQTEGLTRRGISFIKISKFQEGLTDLEKANKQKPNNAEILCNLGLCKIAVKDVTGIKELDLSISLDSTNYGSYYNRGLGKLLIQEYHEAIKDFEKAIILKPDSGEAIFSIGMGKYALGDKENACKYWKKSVDKGYVRAQPIIDQNCQ